MSWKSEPLSAVTSKIGSGSTPRGGDSVYITEGTALIRSQNVYNNEFTSDGLVYIDEKTADKMKGVTVEANDVLVNITGDSVARCCIVNENALPARVNQHVAILRAKKSCLIPHYLAFYMVSPLMQATLLSWAGTGGTRKALTKGMLENFEIPLPPLDIQEKIVGVIKAYNDLIENNRRRIKLLEESARLLYQAWFVHLRFPGHEQVKIVDGLPEGWEKLTVAECCHKPTYGFTASASKDPIGPQFLRITDIVPTSINWAGVPYCDADEATTKKYQLKEGDIVVARTGATVGFAKRMPELNVPVVYASYLVKFSPNPSIIDDLLLGVFMESEQYKEFVRGNAGGAAQPNANAKVLGSAKLLIPTKLLQVEFRANIAPMIEQKFLLEKQNSALEKARDLLLPKLMSGELAV
ncbi:MULTISPECIES: restriction endonuclease subunit S [Vibrio]|uniref:Restriction endonuclease subunit S n=1 Tax=Vibrio cholerae TaxID=666 RepID=A0A544JSP4_VIBCL|nr:MULTISPECIES: restriction endonuclease subunit S [Vibrio]EKF9302904.1 restriction endonuclease subunit S [Vibrio cholerae]MBN7286092.1 restriction endonuclease subunit S [Vibrio paracholerae]MDA5311146.1 restriction endonuclease subunit S [Vibrio cholerae]TQP17233.1 restriction endonuclease subunit S [Vibrio cholerae]TQQ07309.1 restriction endonuclease subunit S [Vibrio cholerae]